MTPIEKKCFRKLDLYDNPTLNPITWAERSKKYAFIMMMCFLINFPFWIVAKTIKAVCLPMHKLYEKLENWV